MAKCNSNTKVGHPAPEGRVGMVFQDDLIAVVQDACKRSTLSLNACKCLPRPS